MITARTPSFEKIVLDPLRGYPWSGSPIIIFNDCNFFRQYFHIIGMFLSDSFNIFADLMEMDQFHNRNIYNKNSHSEKEEEILIEQIKSRRKKRQAPYLIFPEILCIIDYDGYR